VYCLRGVGESGLIGTVRCLVRASTPLSHLLFGMSWGDVLCYKQIAGSGAYLNCLAPAPYLLFVFFDLFGFFQKKQRSERDENSFYARVIR
jgi:hypothetical protein